MGERGGCSLQGRTSWATATPGPGRPLRARRREGGEKGPSACRLEAEEGRTRKRNAGAERTRGEEIVRDPLGVYALFIFPSRKLLKRVTSVIKASLPVRTTATQEARISSSFSREARGPCRTGTCGHTPATTLLPGKGRPGAPGHGRCGHACSEDAPGKRGRRRRTARSRAALLRPSALRSMVKCKSWGSP